MHYNFYPYKIIAGLIAGFVGVLFDNLLPLFLITLFFELVDFTTGVLKSYIVARRKKEKFAFESVKAWRTIYKIIFILVGIIMAEMIDMSIAVDVRLRLANYFAAFCCGVEFWSFLENAAVISNHPVFRWLRKFMKMKVEDQIGADFHGNPKPKKHIENEEDY